MVEGVFYKKDTTGIVLLLIGPLLILAYLFFERSVSVLIFGTGMALCGLSLVLLNFKAFVHIEGDHISARYGWFQKLDCEIDDVAFALCQINTLTLLMRNGKQYSIIGVMNPSELCAAVRQKMTYDTPEPPEAVAAKLDQLKARRKKSFLFVFLGIVLMFVNIFILVFLTGGRDIPDFTQNDWLMMAIMGAVELVTVTVCFYVAARCGNTLIPIEHTKFRLQQSHIFNDPLPSDCASCILTDADYSGRITVCGFPNDTGVYYITELFQPDFALQQYRTSEIYDSEDDLPLDIEEWVDITDHFL